MKCNACWRDLEGGAISTTCGHLLCTEDASKIILNDGACPICDQVLTESLMKHVDINPNEEWINMAMAGISPQILMESAYRSLMFYITQRDLEMQYKMNRVVAECLQGMQSKFSKKMEQRRTAYEKMKHLVGVLTKDKQELQEKFSEKSRQKRKLEEMYDQLHTAYQKKVENDAENLIKDKQELQEMFEPREPQVPVVIDLEQTSKFDTMGGEGEDLEPLFDYHGVQPENFVCIYDDVVVDDDNSATPVMKRAKTSQTVEKADDDVKVMEVAGDDDWIPPPPKVILIEDVEDSTIKALRWKKMELMSFTKNVDVMQEVEESSKREVELSLNPPSEVADNPPPGLANDRGKIVIKIQEKDGEKKYRVFADEKFERIIKMYTDKVKLDPKNLVFIFDGDKIDPSTTPSEVDMEDDDIVEVHSKQL